MAANVRRAVSDRLKIPAMLILACYWLAMLAGTHVVRPELIFPPDLWDKFLHTAAYTGLTVLVLLNLWLRKPWSWRQFVMVFGVLAAAGAVDEVSQLPVGRHTELLDWVADLVGILAGSVMAGLGLAALNTALRRARESTADQNAGVGGR